MAIYTTELFIVIFIQKVDQCNHGLIVFMMQEEGDL